MVPPEKGEINILIVDDIRLNTQMLGALLRGEGYSVSFASDGPQALEIAASQSFDLILLDVMMPGVDGFTVCRELQKSVETRGIPVIFLTARAEKPDILKGFEAGGVDYVTKPFNSPELLARVRTHLELRSSQILLQKRNEELSAANSALENLNQELRKAMREIKILKGILPICMYCKKIRKQGADSRLNDSWVNLELYIENNSQAAFTHSCCPSCMHEHHPGMG